MPKQENSDRYEHRAVVDDNNLLGIAMFLFMLFQLSYAMRLTYEC